MNELREIDWKDRLPLVKGSNPKLSGPQAWARVKADKTLP